MCVCVFIDDSYSDVLCCCLAYHQSSVVARPPRSVNSRSSASGGLSARVSYSLRRAMASMSTSSCCPARCRSRSHGRMARSTMLLPLGRYALALHSPCTCVPSLSVASLTLICAVVCPLLGLGLRGIPRGACMQGSVGEGNRRRTVRGSGGSCAQLAACASESRRLRVCGHSGYSNERPHCGGRCSRREVIVANQPTILILRPHCSRLSCLRH